MSKKPKAPRVVRLSTLGPRGPASIVQYFVAADISKLNMSLRQHQALLDMVQPRMSPRDGYEFSVGKHRLLGAGSFFIVSLRAKKDAEQIEAAFRLHNLPVVAWFEGGD
jgi:hypothetical protein